MRHPVRLFVAGEPAPQGSKSAFPLLRRGGPCGCRRQSGYGRPRANCRRCVGTGTEILVTVTQAEASKRAKPWRRAVRAVALEHRARKLSSRTPVRVAMAFAFARPPSHLAADRKRLTKSGREFPGPQGHGLGDVDKLARAVADALTSALYSDDADVVRLDAAKFWTLGEPGLYVSVAPYAPAGETVESLLDAFAMVEVGVVGDQVLIAHAPGAAHGAAPVRMTTVEVGNWDAPLATPQADLFGGAS